MNEHDSERMKGMLEALGYGEAPARADADLILFNTCSIREKADSCFVTHLGEASRLKRERPEVVVGVGGCWAQSVKEEVFRQFPFVDVAFGPGQVQVSRLLAKASRTNSTQRLELAAAFSLAQGEGFDAAREVLISTARAAGRLSAMSLAMDAAFAVAGLAASYMAAVLVVADALPRTEAAVLATPWRQVMLAPRREADPQPPGPGLESGPREDKATSALGVI